MESSFHQLSTNGEPLYGDMCYSSSDILCVVHVSDDDGNREFACFELVLGNKSFVHVDTHCSAIDESMMMKIRVVEENGGLEGSSGKGKLMHDWIDPEIERRVFDLFV